MVMYLSWNLFNYFPNTLSFISFEGIIEINIIKEILRIHGDNLIKLDFYYYSCVDVLEREINEGRSRKLKLRFDKEKLIFIGH